MRGFIAILILVLLTSSVAATSVSITIYGTNASNAQTNVTKYGANNTVIVNSWNTSYVKNITVNSTNTTGDTFSFNISNVTANSLFELKVNGTTQNAYKSGANGMLNFTYVMTSNLNQTFILSPAVRANGYNLTWIWLTNLSFADGTAQNTASSTTTNQTVQTGKALVTVYQNTGSSIRYGSASASRGALINLSVYVSATNPPNTLVAAYRDGNDLVTHAGTVSFIVLPDYYYSVQCPDAGCALLSWVEWT